MIDFAFILPAQILTGIAVGIVIGVFGIFDFLQPAKNFLSRLLTCETCTAFWSSLFAGTALLIFSEIVQCKIFFVILASLAILVCAVIAAIITKPLCRIIEKKQPQPVATAATEKKQIEKSQSEIKSYIPL